MKYHIYKTDENCVSTEVDVADIAINYGSSGVSHISEVHFGGFSGNPDQTTPNLIWKKHIPEETVDVVSGIWPVYEHIGAITNEITLPIDGTYRIGVASGGGGGTARWRTHNNKHCEYSGGAGCWAQFTATFTAGTKVSFSIGGAGRGDTCHYGRGGSDSDGKAVAGDGGDSTLNINGTKVITCSGGTGAYDAGGGGVSGHSGSITYNSGQYSISGYKFTLFSAPKPIICQNIVEIMDFIRSGLQADNTKITNGITKINYLDNLTYQKYWDQKLKSLKLFITKNKKDVALDLTQFPNAKAVSNWNTYNDIPSAYYSNTSYYSLMSSSIKLAGTKICMWNKDTTTKTYTNELLNLYDSSSASEIYKYVVSKNGTSDYSSAGSAGHKWASSGGAGAISIVYIE